MERVLYAIQPLNFCGTELRGVLGPTYTRLDACVIMYFEPLCLPALWLTRREHIFTGKVLSEVRTERAVFLQVVDGSRPTWPASCPRTRALDNLWDLIQGCWKQNPVERLTAQQIVQQLVGPGIQATANQSTSDWGETLTARFRRSVQMEPLLPSVSKLECMLFGEGLYGYIIYLI